jgi:hypothetical protein
MKANTYAALSALVTLSTETKDIDSFFELIAENRSEFIAALQQISDTDSEQALDGAHFALYIASDDEDMDVHMANCLGTYISLIECASEDFDDDLNLAVTKMLGEGPEDPHANDRIHLESCFGLEAGEQEKNPSIC